MKKPFAFLALAAACLGLHGQLPSVAVFDFSARNDPTLESVIPSVITEVLVNSGKVDVFEREQLSALVAEQEFQTSGLVDPSTAMALGQLSGIDYLVTGEIIDFGREVRSFSGYGVRTETVFYRMEAALRVMDTQTGRVVFSRTAQKEERQNRGSGMVISDSTIDARLGRDLANELGYALLQSPVFQTSAKAAVEALPVSFTVTSAPEMASVEIDGIFYGNAGGSFEVPEGVHLIKVSLPGYAVWEKRVMVREGATFHVPLVREADIRVEVDESAVIRTETAQPE